MPNYRNIDLHAIARKAMAQYGFQFQFPKFVTEEVRAINEEGLLKNRQGDLADLRSLLWSSIDNTDSLDLDQLEYCERGLNQGIKVFTAIADVDLLVPKQSHADQYAAHNGTSVYTGIETFPMLPQRLSTDLTSLRTGQDRQAIIVEFTVLADGNIQKGSAYRALVRNKAKLAYEEIGDWLEGKGPIPYRLRQIAGLEEQLRLQDEAAQRLKSFRTEQGALELDTIEANPIVREERVAALEVPRRNRARYLIENFMIAANGTITGFLEKAGIPMIQRVVRVPKNWMGIREAAASCNETLPAEPDSRALSQFLLRQKAVDPEHFPDLSLTIVKLLGAGEYMVLEPGKAPCGHFGLAVMDYTHATAPNRRYADVIIQRLLKAILDRQSSPYTQEELTGHAALCTDRDKAAKKVERFMRKAAAAVLLGDRLGESFDAIVTGVSEKGNYARLISPPVEGRVIRGGEGMVVGQKVHVRLISMDPYKGYIDFERISGDIAYSGHV